MNTFGRTGLLTSAATAVFILAGIQLTLAHSVVQSSLPPANASLDTPPQTLLVTFSEPVDPGFSTLTVLDRNGQTVSTRPVFSRDGRRITVPLKEISRGVYSVRWRVLSAIDGHTTTGFFAFAVGQAIAPDLQFVRAAGPPPSIVIVHWISLLAAILLAGTASFQASVLHPSLVWLNSPDASRLASAADNRLRTLTVLASWILLGSLVVGFVLEAMLLLDSPLRVLIASGTLWRLLATTRAGWGVLVRASMGLVFLLPLSPRGRILRVAALLWFLIVGGIAVLLGGLSAFASTHVALLLLIAVVFGLFSTLMAVILPQLPDVQIPPAPWVAPSAAAVLLAGITLTAHASGSGPLAAFADWLHLVAVAFWIGGLASLLLVLISSTSGDRAQLTRALVTRFSAIAAASLAVLAITGVYSAWLYLPSLQAFRVTAYGRTLFLKLVLIVPLVTIGALNRFVLRPRLERGSGRVHSVQQRFLRFIAVESAIGIVVLLVVAVLTITPPARVSMPAAAQRSLNLARLADGVRVRVGVTPASPGWNQIEVGIRDSSGKGSASEDRVLLRLTKLDEERDRVTIPLTLRRGEHYILEGMHLSTPGWWELDVMVRRPGLPDVTTSFPLRLGEEPKPALDIQAVRLLERVRAAMDTVQAWRQVDQIADGIGNVIVTTYEMSRPNRLHYRTSAGGESVFIGLTRYTRGNTLAWQRDVLSEPLALNGPYLDYLAGAENVRLGRRDRCGSEPCQVVLWDAPRGIAAFAGWIGLHTYRVHRLLMVAPAHYMTSQPSDFNARIEIRPPR